MAVRFLPILAAVSGLEASVIAGKIVEPGTLEAISQFPLTVVLGAVCAVSIVVGFMQSRESARCAAAVAKEHAAKMLAMIEGERLAAEKMEASHASATNLLATDSAKALKEVAVDSAKAVKELAVESAKALRELADSNSKDIHALVDKIISMNRKQ